MRQAARMTRMAVAALSALATLPAGRAYGDDFAGGLPPQPLVSALEAFARHSGLQLVYSSYLGKGLMSKGTVPGLSIQETLRQLLDGTGLEFEFVNDHTVTIVENLPLSPDEDTSDLAAEISTLGRGARALRALRESEIADALSLALRSRPLTQVTVTGTHIPDTSPVGSQLITMSRRQIDRTGLSTVQDVIRALPQSFGGGPSEDTSAGQEAALNVASAGTGLNLRGLGAGSTLVLVNGRRLAPGGGDGRFVDVSVIPLSAVERVEVLPDGASAIYGSDAVGGVINFVLREDFEGAETHARFGAVTDGPTGESQVSQLLGQRWKNGSALVSLDYYSRDELPASARRQAADSDLRWFGGDNFNMYEGSPGTITDLTNTWAIPRGQDGSDLEPSDFVAGTMNSHNRNEGRSLLPQHKRASVVGSIKQDMSAYLGKDAELFADILVSRRNTKLVDPAARQLIAVPESNAFYVNPSGGSGPVYVHYGFAEDLGLESDKSHVDASSIVGGGAIDITPRWRATAYLSHARSSENISGTNLVDQSALQRALADPDPATAFNPFGDGSFTNPETLDLIRDTAYLKRSVSIRTVSVSAEGALARWRDRDFRLAIGSDVRSQSLDSFFRQDDTVLWDRHGQRDVTSAYAEVLIPIFDDAHRRPGFNHAQLSLSARREHYSDFGSATTPRIGLSWSPIDTLSFRGSWSRSVKAPNLADLDEGANGVQINTFTDPEAPTGASRALLWFGGNDELREETATSWTLGADLKLIESGLNLGITYFDIDFRDRVDRIEYNTALLSDPAYASLIKRNPSQAEVDAICRKTRIVGTISDCTSASVNAIVDMRLNNVAVMKTNGLDVLGNYRFDTAAGAFNAGLNATYILHYTEAQFPRSPRLDLLNTPGEPIDLRLRGSLSWDRGAMGVSTHLNYAAGYRDTISDPGRTVGSWTTLDLQMTYALPGLGTSLLEGSDMALSVQNVLNVNPPLLNNPAGVA